MTDWMNWDKASEFISAMEPLKNGDTSLWAVFTHACKETNYFKWVIGKNNYWHILRPKRFEVFAVLNEDGNLKEYADWETPAEGITFYLDQVNKHHNEAMVCKKCSHCYLRGVRMWRADNDNAADSYFKELMRIHRFIQGEDRIMKAFRMQLDYTEI